MRKTSTPPTKLRQLFSRKFRLNGVIATEANESKGNSCAASEGERWCGKCRTCGRRARDQLGLLRFGSTRRGAGSPILDPGGRWSANLELLAQYPCTVPPVSCQNWSQLSDSAFLDRVNNAKIPVFYGLVKHCSRTPPQPSSTPNLLAISLAIGRR